MTTRPDLPAPAPDSAAAERFSALVAESRNLVQVALTSEAGASTAAEQDPIGPEVAAVSGGPARATKSPEDGKQVTRAQQLERLVSDLLDRDREYGSIQIETWNP